MLTYWRENMDYKLVVSMDHTFKNTAQQVICLSKKYNYRQLK